jgi:hypothetical protein
LKPSHNPEQRARLSGKQTPRCGESGYAYIMALFMVLTVIVGSQIALRNLVTENRSQREGEMIWRGNQYARAIRSYYRKTGHYPQSQDDLLTGVPDLHFLRAEAVKDPMNKQDGAWRFIYTNASGAIIGSVKYGSLQQMALMDMNGGQMPGTQPATGANSNGQSSSSDNSASTSTAFGTTSVSPSISASSPTSSSASGGFSLSPTSTGANAPTATGTTVLGPLGQPVTGAMAGPQPTGPVEGPVFGGQLIGVGSTVDSASIKVYKGGKKYNQWEFIWNPIEEQAMAMQQGLVSGAGAGQPGGGIPGLGLPIAPVSGTTGTTGGTTPAPGSSDSGSSGTSGGSNNSTNPTQ